MNTCLRVLACGLVATGLASCSSGEGTPQDPPPKLSNGGTETAAGLESTPESPPAHAPANPTAKDAPREASRKLTRGEIVDRVDQCVVLIETTNSAGKPLGTGSGFLVDARGWVATCWHVVEQATAATAKLRDGTTLEFEGIVAVNKDSDVAVLKLKSPLPDATPLELGPAEPPRQGDAVTAIGHPRGFNFTMTEGIVSAVRRSSELPEKFARGRSSDNETTWIQTTAAISGGNSGGPLLDEYGRAVGINTWVASGENLGFASHISHLSALLAEPPGELQPLPGDLPLEEMENPLAQLEPRVVNMFEDYQAAARQHQLEQLRGNEDAPDPAPKYADRFYKLADANRGTLLAFQALWLACRMDDAEGDAAALKKSLERLAKDHVAVKGLHLALQDISRSGHPAAREFLRTVIRESPHPRNQGMASVYLAILLHQGEESVQHKDEVVALLERCQDEFKDLKVQTRSNGAITLGEFAKPYLHQVKHLSVGSTAMDILGKDVEGLEFKLSDYQGKVVLLDFFADWCPYCAAMYPHERKLVEQSTGQPFVLLGISTDSPDTLRQLVNDGKVTWRCWADGRGGPIAEQWQVTSYPTLFLLDHEGVIRHVIHGQPDARELDAKIVELVKQVPRPGRE